MEAARASSSAGSAARPWTSKSWRRCSTRRAQYNELARALAAAGRFPVALVAITFGVGRSTAYDRLAGTAKARGRYAKANNAVMLPLIRQIAAQRPAQGYRRIAAVLAALVQVPCIERNAAGSIEAIEASGLAMLGDGTHRVSLDQVIATMRRTGLDIGERYKETPLGGLAVNLVEC